MARRAWLAAHPKVDPARIGVAGFSFGAVAAMLAATRAQNDKFLPGGQFAALMPVYPICHLYNRVSGFEFGDLVDAPVLIITGRAGRLRQRPGRRGQSSWPRSARLTPPGCAAR